MMIRALGVLFYLSAPSLQVLATSAALAQQALIVADYDTNAIAFRPQTGKVATFLCPSTLTRTIDIWGTDVYRDESPICTAAVHAGVLTPGTSGQVTIVMGSGAESFLGKRRYGVTSLSYGPWDSTYSFIKSSEPGQIDWYTTYDRVPDDFHSPITVVCPPKGNADTYVWGTDVYRSDSGICPAAVHAGVITLDAGGRVTVTLMPKQETFVGSERNGISTQTWTDWDFRSYGQPYKVTPAATSISSRMIKISGFTAAGSAATVVPRTITLSGFSAMGTSTAIVPRTIPLPGWTGVGAPTTH
jgi:hypothetical protein